ncbi:MAG TPA: glycoside hydrolase family 2 TIM barrel-domain containing protein [Ruminiclostridium sp.]|nr:glycoside hydrolase family 2 TIM barrel-domain containing protein [Ruminiclostridium sp.]
MIQPRSEHPQPQFERETWLNLNGEWEFEFDDNRRGNNEKWFHHGKAFTMKIQVPFTFQSKLSGIGKTEFHDVVWYRKSFNLPGIFSGKHIILHFGAVDYQADVWVNEQHVIFHQGGNTPFKADITNELIDGENSIVVRVEDFSTDITLPRGKQYWKEKSAGIWYTNTTGIWQTVWLEAVSDIYLEKVRYTPFIDTTEIQIQSFINGFDNLRNIYLKLQISYDGNNVVEDIYKVKANTETRRIRLHEFNEHDVSRLWTPENPHLYDVQMALIVDGDVIDEVRSYFGMRKISVDGSRILLNNQPYTMRMVLDQGYFPDGILTPPSEEAIRNDVELTKAMGFNGARKHQKVEDPRYLYWCDKLGLIVWGEMANAFDFSEDYAKKFAMEWQEVIERDYNHPCIVVWVPLNESWGIPKVLSEAQQQHHALAMYHMTKSLDATRLVVSNDGWELLKTDLCNIHDYEYQSEVLEKRYSNPENACSAIPWTKKIHLAGYEYGGEPILVTEFGGISFKKSETEGWGYSGAASEEDFTEKLKAVVEPLKKSPVVKGFCYTQLTDVEQEINGLLTYDRKPKIPLETIKSIIEGK